MLLLITSVHVAEFFPRLTGGQREHRRPPVVIIAILVSAVLELKNARVTFGLERECKRSVWSEQMEASAPRAPWQAARVIAVH